MERKINKKMYIFPILTLFLFDFFHVCLWFWGNQANKSIHSVTVISLSLGFNQLNAYQAIEWKFTFGRCWRRISIWIQIKKSIQGNSLTIMRRFRASLRTINSSIHVCVRVQNEGNYIDCLNIVGVLINLAARQMILD